MTTNFRKFRKQSRLSFVFMLLTVGAFISVIAFSIIGEMVAMGIGLVMMFVFGGIGLVFEWMAYDNLICPKCGNRILKPLRESFTKENWASYRRIDKGETVECVHCGTRIETA